MVEFVPLSLTVKTNLEYLITYYDDDDEYDLYHADEVSNNAGCPDR